MDSPINLQSYHKISHNIHIMACEKLKKLKKYAVTSPCAVFSTVALLMHYPYCFFTVIFLRKDKKHFPLSLWIYWKLLKIKALIITRLTYYENETKTLKLHIILTISTKSRVSSFYCKPLFLETHKKVVKLQSLIRKMTKSKKKIDTL